MNSIVLDSSAVLALLLGEPGGDRVDAIRHRAVMSTVNICEVLTRLMDMGYAMKRAEAAFADLDIAQSPFDRADASVAASLRSSTRTSGLSLGDRACLALARRGQWPIVTSDRAWLEVEVGLDIQLIR